MLKKTTDKKETDNGTNVIWDYIIKENKQNDGGTVHGEPDGYGTSAKERKRYHWTGFIKR